MLCSAIGMWMGRFSEKPYSLRERICPHHKMCWGQGTPASQQEHPCTVSKEGCFMNENICKKHDSLLKPPPALLPCGTTSLSVVLSSAYLADGLTTEPANPEKSHDSQPEFRVFDVPSSPLASHTPHR